MKQTFLDDLKPGMKLARPVMVGGHVLLDTGTEITEEYKKKLFKRGISFVYIEEEIQERKEEAPQGDPVGACLKRLKAVDQNTAEMGRLLELVRQAGKLADARLIPDLSRLMKLKSSRVDMPRLKEEVLNALLAMPQDSALSNIFLVQLSLNNTLQVRAKALEGITKFGGDEGVYPLLSKVTELPMALIPQIKEHLMGYKGAVLKASAEKILTETKDKTEVGRILSILEDCLDDATMEGFYPKFLGKKRPKQRTSLQKEKIRETKSVEEVLTEAPVRKIDVGSEQDMKSMDVESMLNFDEDDVFIPELIKPVQFKTDVNLKSEFQNLYNGSLDETSDMLKDFRAGLRVKEKKIEEIVGSIVSQIQAHPADAFTMISNNTLKNYLLSHAMNVTYLSILLGKLKGFSESELVLLGCSSLLHDVGMVKIDSLAWNEPRSLTDLEFLDVKKHTIYGIDSLIESTRFPKEIGYVAYQHHERLDGSGYPKERKLHLIDKMAQIVGLCDVFEAMSSTRVYRKMLPVEEIFNHLLHEMPGAYNQEFVKLLYDFVGSEVDKELESKLSQLSGQSVSVQARSGAPRIIVIDDNPDICQLVVHVLERDGYETLSINDPAVAMEKIREFKPHMAVIDLMMPGISGFDLCKMIRDDRDVSEVPIVILTARKDRQSVERVRQFSISGYISKPFRHAELREKISKILETVNTDN